MNARAIEQMDVVYQGIFLHGSYLSDLSQVASRSGGTFSIVIATGTVTSPFYSSMIRMNIDRNGSVTAPRRWSIIVEKITEWLRKPNSKTLAIPVRLDNGTEVHANTMLFLRTPPSRTVKIYLFEPHGSDAQSPGQSACGFRNYYNSLKYFEAIRTFLKNMAKDIGDSLCQPFVYTFHSPKDYEPPVFGQSTSGVLGKGKGDKWCAFWTTWFTVYSHKHSPEEFVAMVQSIPVVKRQSAVVLAMKDVVKFITNGRYKG